MNAALKKVFSFGQFREFDFAALQDPGPCHCKILKATGTFRNGISPCIERWYEAAAKLCHLGKGVRLATLVDHAERRPFLDHNAIGLEIPARIRRAGGRLGEQLVQRGESSQSYVLAKIRRQAQR